MLPMPIKVERDSHRVVKVLLRRKASSYPLGISLEIISAFFQFFRLTYIKHSKEAFEVTDLICQASHYHLSIMTEDLRCLQMPVDHRLRPLLHPDLLLPDPDPRLGKHVTFLEQYGLALQSKDQSLSPAEIQFAKSLAMPETKGGVVIVLRQPAPNQQYDSRDFGRIIQECETLKAIDDVLRAIIGSSLKETSCFDAFPFQKVPIPTSSETGYSEYDEAYSVYKEMIQEKQPHVVLCCYKSPDKTKFKLLYSIGVGMTREFPVKLKVGSCIAVNGFHPSYAVNYNRTESCFRTLYMLEMLKAHRINQNWTDQEWMNQLRTFCRGRVNDLMRGKFVTKSVDTIITV